MHNYLVFNGISSEQLGLEVEQIPNANRPARKFDRYSVPGRNGDIIIMQDAWDNVEQSYEIWWGREPGDAVEGGEMIAKWLFGDSGYQTLTDSYDPKHYRKAVFTGPFDVENTLLRYGRATITFDCDPRRFLMSGLDWIPFPTPGSASWLELLNPTPFPAKPVIDITIAPGAISNIAVTNDDGTSMFLTINKSGHFIIDSARESIIDENGDPAFDSTWGAFPTLYPGRIKINPQLNAKIQTNWWTL